MNLKKIKFFQSTINFKRKMNKKQFISLLIVAVFFISQIGLILNSFEANAQTLWDRQEGRDEIKTTFYGSTSGPSDIRIVVINIIKIFLTFIGIIFITLIIYAGFRWMTSSGSQDKISEAKSIIKASVIGVIIIIAAYMITTFVGNSIQQAISGDPFNL
jgi:hypothetical protein